MPDTPDAAEWIQRITAIASTDDNLDFSHYKRSTLQRRIERRCRVSGRRTLEDYLALLERSEAERTALRHDLLIRVTGFFRDPQAWLRLETEVLPRLVEQARERGAFRAWVAGCCTGEEAYSLGMLVLEAFERTGTDAEVKIFATDIDPGSLDHATAGVFPVIGDEVSEARKQTFFKKRGDGWAVTPELRRTLIFARHNLAQDAPFTRMQLVSCRNLLIYMQPELQRHVLESVSYALDPHGVLFLGSAESPGGLPGDFADIDRKARLFEKLRDSSRVPRHSTRPAPKISRDPVGRATASEPRGRRTESLADEVFAEHLRTRRSACLVVTTDCQLVQAFGDTRRFLSVPEGRQFTDVTKMVSRELALPLQALVHRAARDEDTAAYRSIRVDEGDSRRSVDLRASCRKTTFAALVTVLLEEGDDPPEESPAVPFDGETLAAQRIGQLENDLQQTRENLQATIEELQTTNEEQQATNEELLAANEELQSTNEELHSVNEELHTVNAEHQSKIQELTQLHNDVDNLLSCTEIATVFLDRELRVRKFTEPATRIFNILEQDIGRPIGHITHQLSGRSDEWMQSIRPVLETGEPAERNVETKAGRGLLARITPYRDHRGRIEGVVLTFVDISETRRALAEVDLLHRLVVAITAASDFTAALQIALREVCETCGWSYGEAWVPDREESRLVCSPAWHGHEPKIAAFRRASEPLTFRRGEGMPGRAWSSGKPEWIPDVRVAGKLFHRAEAAQAAELGAAVSVPVFDGNAVVAELAFFMSAPRPREQRMLELVSTVAAQLGSTLQRKRGDEALRRTITLLQQITENVEDVFYVRDHESGRMLFVSPAYEGLWGRKVDALLASPEEWLDAVHASERPALERAREQGRGFDLRYRIVRPDGSLRWIWDRAFAIREPGDGARRVAGIARDVTTQREIRELVRSNADLEQFAYAASHDLKAPLRAISNLALWVGEDIAETKLDAAQEKLAQLRQRSDRMRSLVSDLLEYARAGQPQGTLEEVDVRRLVEDVAGNLHGDGTHRVECQGDLPVLHTARAPLTRVFENLVGNAVQHHGGSSCRVEVSCRDRGESHEFRVADDGPGIAEEDRERVFRLFQKLESRDRNEGSGLGLALVKRIVEEFGGSARLEDNEPRGLVVCFDWPKDLEARLSV